MGTLMHRNKGEKVKRYKAIAAAVGTGLLLVTGWPTLLVVAGGVGTGFLTWDWFKFRAQNGMRF
jgi:hypothetical protein